MEIQFFFKFLIFILFNSLFLILLIMVAICKGIDSVLGTCFGDIKDTKNALAMLRAENCHTFYFVESLKCTKFHVTKIKLSLKRK